YRMGRYAVEGCPDRWVAHVAQRHVQVDHTMRGVHVRLDRLLAGIDQVLRVGARDRAGVAVEGGHRPGGGIHLEVGVVDVPGRVEVGLGVPRNVVVPARQIVDIRTRDTVSCLGQAAQVCYLQADVQPGGVLRVE